MDNYFEGTQIVKHEDGSTSYITYEHEPPYVPLTTKQKILSWTFLIGGSAAALSVTYLAEKMLERSGRKFDERDRQKQNREIYQQAKSS